MAADEPLATRSMSGRARRALGLAIGLVALGLLFHAEIAAAVKTWIDSTAYNHCFLVIPIVAVPDLGPASRRCVA